MLLKEIFPIWNFSSLALSEGRLLRGVIQIQLLCTAFKKRFTLGFTLIRFSNDISFKISCSLCVKEPFLGSGGVIIRFWKEPADTQFDDWVEHYP